MPMLMMGCGVFLQSDIVNQQRKGWSADEIMAGVRAVRVAPLGDPFQLCTICSLIDGDAPGIVQAEHT